MVSSSYFAYWFSMCSMTKANDLVTGECKPLVGEYLRCVKRLNGTNAPECRGLAKNYLQCRMNQ